MLIFKICPRVVRELRELKLVTNSEFECFFSILLHSNQINSFALTTNVCGALTISLFLSICFQLAFIFPSLFTHLFHSWGHKPLFVCGSVGARQLFVTKKILNSEQCKLLIMMTNDDSDDDGSGGGDGNCDRISLSLECFHRQRC